MAALGLSGICFLVRMQHHRDGFNRLETNKKGGGPNDKARNQKQMTQRFGTLTRKERLAKHETAFWALRSEKVKKEPSPAATAVVPTAKPEPATLSESWSKAEKYFQNRPGDTDRWQQELQQLQHTQQQMSSAAAIDLTPQSETIASSAALREKAESGATIEKDTSASKPAGRSRITPVTLPAPWQMPSSGGQGMQPPSGPAALAEGTGEAGILERRARRRKDMEEARQKFQAQELERESERRKRMQVVERERERQKRSPAPGPEASLATPIETTNGSADSKRAAVPPRSTSQTGLLTKHAGPHRIESQAQSWIDPFTPYKLS